ncbi:MAG TPA: pilus assembly protein PilM [Dehalococcoidia bacterium]|nr:pilus assembly protein PilM [Dehalococcoidia bacterium]
MAKNGATLMAKQVVTLYIDDTNLKLLVVRGNQVKKWATLPLESGLIRDGEVADRTQVAARIQELLKSQGVGGRKVIVGLSGLHCLFRVITLPRLPEAQLAEAVAWEAKRVLPVPVEELYLSWQVVSTSEEKTQVFVAALPRNVADTLIETLREAGIKPYLIDLAPLALARVVSEATAIVVDVQSAEVDIVVMVEGVPQLIRSLTLPREAASLNEKLPAIKDELKRTIHFYNSSHPEQPLEPSVPVFASGELAEEPSIYQSLAEELNYSFSSLSSPLKYPEGLAPAQYMVNIGLAFKKLPLGKQATFSVVELNVLPEVYQPKGIPVAKILVSLGIIVAIGLLVPVAMRVQDAAADTVVLRTQVGEANHLLQQMQEEQELQKQEFTELEEKVAEAKITLDNFTSVLSGFSGHRAKVNGDLDETMLDKPSGVELSNITHSGVTLTIEGTYSSEEKVLDYAYNLGASGRFSQIIISTMEKAETGEKSFTLTLTSRG